MNIAIFTPSQNPYSETFIQAHKNLLQGSIFYYYGARLRIKLENHPKLYSKWSFKVWKILFKLFKSKQFDPQNKYIINSLKKHKIDVILVEYGHHAHQLLPILKLSKIPFAVHFHGYDASAKKALEMTNNYQEVFEYASSIIAVSKKMHTMLLEIGCPKEKLVYNVYGPQDQYKNCTPHFSKKQLVTVGRFTDKKAPYYTILAFKKTLDKHPNATLVMGGDGFLLPTCKNLVNYLNIEQQVIFAGIVTSEQFMSLINDSIAYVQHSITAANGDMEGTPLAILEASSAGLPIISTFHAGIPDVVLDNETGFLVEEHNVNEMAEKMIRLLDDPILAEAMGKQNRMRIQNHFSMTRHIKSLQEILEAIR